MNILLKFFNPTETDKDEQARKPSFQGNKNKTARSTVSIGHKKWTDAERRTLQKAYERRGDNWDAIARCVSGRSKEECMEEIKDIWVVQKFVDHKPSSEKNGGWVLRTRWALWSDEDDTWEPIVEKYEEVPHLVEQYIKLNPDVFIGKKIKREREVEEDDNERDKKKSKYINIAGREAPTRHTCQRREITRWTDKELRVLVSLKDRKEKWELIAEAVSKVGCGRTLSGCSNKYLGLSETNKCCIRSGKGLHSNSKPRSWTNEELQVLISSQENEDDWETTSEAVTRLGCIRSINACQAMFYRLSEKQIEKIWSEIQLERRGSWTSEKDTWTDNGIEKSHASKQSEAKIQSFYEIILCSLRGFIMFLYPES
jgi:hypothetical protein